MVAEDMWWLEELELKQALQFCFGLGLFKMMLEEKDPRTNGITMHKKAEHTTDNSKYSGNQLFELLYPLQLF